MIVKSIGKMLGHMVKKFLVCFVSEPPQLPQDRARVGNANVTITFFQIKGHSLEGSSCVCLVTDVLRQAHVAGVCKGCDDACLCGCL